MNEVFKDKDYWQEFYAKVLKEEKLLEPSPFAKSILSKGVIKKGDVLLELGCGNGRDAIYFAKNDISVKAIDQCENTTTRLNTIQGISAKAADFTNLEELETPVDVIYSRFTLHSISLSGELSVLKWTANNLKVDGKFCIEVRTVKDPIFGKGIDKGNNVWFYEGHHRRFVEANKFKNRLLKAGFAIEYFEENSGFAPFKKQDPIILRVIAVKTKDQSL